MSQIVSPRYVFIGNRRFVLEEMIALDCNIASVITIGNTRIERDFEAGILPPVAPRYSVNSKRELLEVLKDIEYDILVSNGCPFILPIPNLPQAKYINIHPSCLPDLRGVDPVVGSILYKRDSGATCHIMDAGIDTGPIISQVRIPFSEDFNATLLYQMSFYAEKMAFQEAFRLKFVPQKHQEATGSEIYYTCQPGDRVITFTEPNDMIEQKIKAFSNSSKGCIFYCNGEEYKVFSCKRLKIPFLDKLMAFKKDGEITFVLENGLIFKRHGEIFEFSSLTNASGKMPVVGDILLAQNKV